VIKRIIIIFTTLLVLIYQQGFSQNWLPLNSGLGCDSAGGYSSIRNIYADQQANKIYVSGNLFNSENGEFETCESVTSGVSMWNGKRFTNLNGGRYFHQGWEITKFKNDIFCSAPIPIYPNNTSDGFYKWNGLSWDTLYNAPNSRVVCSKEINGELWVGGWFDKCGVEESFMLCKIDGQNFYALNNVFPLQDDNFISSMDFLNDTLYVAGDFRNWGINGEDSISTIAKFYNNRLYGIKPYLASISGINYDCLVNFKNELYLGGIMRFEGEDTIHYLLKYDGEKFSRVGTPDMQLNQQPSCMKVYNNELYILGIFSKLGEQEAQQLVKWDGENYTILNTDTIFSRSGFPNTILSATDFDILNDTLYVVGSFYRIGNDTMRCIAKLNRALSDPANILSPTENSLTIYPNPSSYEVTFGYSLSRFTNVKFNIYDIRGRLVKKIEKGKKEAGKYVFEKVDISILANGIYFVQLQIDSESITKKILKED
jgi:Secretion system C-terminal sorting domain